MMKRRMKRKFHVRCEAGENLEITSKSYLSLSDLADLGTVMQNVYHTKEEMIDCVNAFYDGMVARSEEMKQHPNYKTGENYAYLGLPPCFLIFDEYVAFFEMLATKESMSLLSQLKKIVMLGRQAGYFLIVACQRPDAKYFSDGIRDIVLPESVPPCSAVLHHHSQTTACSDTAGIQKGTASACAHLSTVTG